jgi:hypothetical protein
LKLAETGIATVVAEEEVWVGEPWCVSFFYAVFWFDEIASVNAGPKEAQIGRN